MGGAALWRRPATHWRVVIAVAAALLVGHLAWASVSRNGADLARCGALSGVLAGLLIARPILRMGYGTWYSASRIYGGGSYLHEAAELAIIAFANHGATR